MFYNVVSFETLRVIMHGFFLSEAGSSVSHKICLESAFALKQKKRKTGLHVLSHILGGGCDSFTNVTMLSLTMHPKTSVSLCL